MAHLYFFFIPDWSSKIAISRKDSSQFSSLNQLASINTSSSNSTSSSINSDTQGLISDSNLLLDRTDNVQQNPNSSIKNNIAYNSTDKQRKIPKEELAILQAPEELVPKKIKTQVVHLKVVQLREILVVTTKVL